MVCAGVRIDCIAEDPDVADGPSGIAIGAVTKGLGSGEPWAKASAMLQASSGVAACKSPSLARIKKASPAWAEHKDWEIFC